MTHLDRVKNELFNDNEHNLVQQPWSNINVQERKALDNLRKRTDLVINKADKGSTIVVLSRDQYIADGVEHLSDTNTYRQLEHDTTQETKAIITHN